MSPFASNILVSLTRFTYVDVFTATILSTLFLFVKLFQNAKCNRYCVNVS